jgi:hypothetical protein
MNASTLPPPFIHGRTDGQRDIANYWYRHMWHSEIAIGPHQITAHTANTAEYRSNYQANSDNSDWLRFTLISYYHLYAATAATKSFRNSDIAVRTRDDEYY